MDVKKMEENEKIPYHKPFPLSESDIQVLQWQIGDIMRSGQITNSEIVKTLECKIKEMYDVAYCIATANCTIGLAFCYDFFDCNEIFMPSFTWPSPYMMLSSKYMTNFTDINLKTWLMEDPETIFLPNSIISPNHTFGNILNMEREHNIVFDGAHALGSKIENTGEATVFSLAPTKLVTSCEGGLVLTNNDELAKFVVNMRDKCARMSEVHAAIGLQTLFYLERIKRWKKMVYIYYKSLIPGEFQQIDYDSNYNTIGFLNYHDLKIPDFIETRQYYVPLSNYNFKNTQDVYSKMICLPSYYNCDYKKITKSILELNEI
jgi:dTDP-4-amino-4,6-dideoxygalactose transaminase